MPASGTLFTPLDARLPAAPSGQQLVNELRKFARINGLSLVETLALVGKGIEWIRSLEDSRKPTAATIARVRGLVLQLQDDEKRVPAVYVPAAGPGPGEASVPSPGQPSCSDAVEAGPTPGQALAAEIRAFCDSKGISYVAFLARAGVAPNTLTKLQKTVQPRQATLARVRAAMSSSAEPEASQAATIPDEESHTSSEVASQLPAPPAAAAEPVPTPSRVADEVAREAEAAVRRKTVARQIGHGSDHLLMPAPAALQAALIDDPQSAMRAIARAWPELWRQLIDNARARDELPGAFFFDVVRAGLRQLGNRIEIA